MQTRHRGQRPGFTLVELLVVISIIAVLLTLVSVAGYRALIAVRQNMIAVEVNGLESAINAYKEQRGGDLPPDCSNAANALHVNVLAAHIRKAYPRNRQTPAQITALATQLDQAEALVYFLGGNPNPNNNPFDNQEYPITGPGQSKKLYDFPTARLIDVDGDGYCTFVPAYGAQRAPYVYFDSRTYGLSTFGDATFGYVCPYGTDTPTGGSSWESPTTFQIISAGLDGNYGAWPAGPPFSNFKFYPSGTGGGTRVPYSREDKDNVTSFAEGSLDSKLP